MISRMWRGWTRPDDADAYQRFLTDHLFPSLRRVDGFAGAQVLRRDAGEEVEFVTIGRFASLDAVKAFAGEAYQTPVIEPEAARLLARYEGQARHYQTHDA
jgi:antibiotic biosynthesis monooxygenase (ABM) superfamily enzyme